jgi:hypothetical protein
MISEPVAPDVANALAGPHDLCRSSFSPTRRSNGNNGAHNTTGVGLKPDPRTLRATSSARRLGPDLHTCGVRGAYYLDIMKITATTPTQNTIRLSAK